MISLLYCFFMDFGDNWNCLVGFDKLFCFSFVLAMMKFCLNYVWTYDICLWLIGAFFWAGLWSNVHTVLSYRPSFKCLFWNCYQVFLQFFHLGLPSSVFSEFLSSNVSQFYLLLLGGFQCWMRFLTFGTWTELELFGKRMEINFVSLECEQYWVDKAKKFIMNELNYAHC